QPRGHPEVRRRTRVCARSAPNLLRPPKGGPHCAQWAISLFHSMVDIHSQIGRAAVVRIGVSGQERGSTMFRKARLVEDDLEETDTLRVLDVGALEGGVPVCRAHAGA